MNRTFERFREDHEDEELARRGRSMSQMPARGYRGPRRAGGASGRGRPRRPAWVFRPWIFRLPYPTLPWSLPVASVAPEPEPEPEPEPDGRAAVPEEAVEDAESEEERAERGPLFVKLVWEKLVTIPELMAIVTNRPVNGRLKSIKQQLAGRSGIYLVESRGVPIYVGETKSFLDRYRGLHDAWRIGATDNAQGTVWFGRFATIAPNTSANRKTVEHAIIRTLKMGMLGNYLRNSKSILQFDVVGPITIENLLPETCKTKIVVGEKLLGKYGKRENRLRLEANSQFEIESWLG